MNKKIITTSEAPAAIGPYSQAIRIGEFLYTSGQISLDPNSMELITGNIEVETERVLKNIEAILNADGLKLNNIIKTTVYLTDLSEFGRMNQVYEKFFVENINKSFSILRLEKIIPAVPLELKNVYSQIETKIKKSWQDSVKVGLLDHLKQKYRYSYDIKNL